MTNRLEPGFDVEIADAIDATGFRIRILCGGNSNVCRGRQIAASILRPQIMAPLLAPSSSGTLCAKSLGSRHRRIALASKWQAANRPQCPLSGAKQTMPRCLLLTQSGHPCWLFWHTPLHRICARGVSDAPRGICGQARTDTRFQQFDIIRSRRGDNRLHTRRR